MSETRRMHFVPRTYLKHFAEKRAGVYFITALPKGVTDAPFVTNITNICVEKDIYALEGATEEQRQFIENMYSDLYEKNYDKIYEILTDEKKDSITLDERYSIIAFVVSTFYRNSSWVTGHNNLMNETLEKAYNLSKINEKDSFFLGEQEVSIVGKTLEELQQDSRKQDMQMIALVAAKKIFELIRLRVINDVITITKASANNEYITSDNPVTFRAETSGMRAFPIDPTNTLSIPIDKSHLLQLRPWGHELDRTSIGRISENSLISTLNVAMNNQFQYSQSGRFLLGSESAIKNFRPDRDGEILRKQLREKL